MECHLSWKFSKHYICKLDYWAKYDENDNSFIFWGKKKDNNCASSIVSNHGPAVVLVVPVYELEAILTLWLVIMFPACMVKLWFNLNCCFPDGEYSQLPLEW